MQSSRATKDKKKKKDAVQLNQKEKLQVHAGNADHCRRYTFESSADDRGPGTLGVKFL